MDNECLICLDSANNMIKLDSCNKYIHETCLHNWITFNLDKNHKINKCFFCQNNNSYINNIINEKINGYENSLNEIIIINIDSQENNNSNIAKYICYTCSICITVGLSIFIFIIIL